MCRWCLTDISNFFFRILFGGIIIWKWLLFFINELWMEQSSHWSVKQEDLPGLTAWCSKFWLVLCHPKRLKTCEKKTWDCWQFALIHLKTIIMNGFDNMKHLCLFSNHTLGNQSYVTLYPNLFYHEPNPMIIKHHIDQLFSKRLLNILLFQWFSKPMLINDNVPFVTTR